MALAVVASLFACESTWDEHYKDVASERYDGGVMDYLSGRSEYSGFVALLRKHGLDTKISESGANTVFAVKNEQLAPIENLEGEAQLRAVSLHIGNTLLYGYNIPEEGTGAVKSMASKNVWLERTGGKLFASGEIALTAQDKVCADGVVHELASTLELKNSILEQINTMDGAYEPFRKYVNREELLFDEPNSVEVGKNIFGQTVYDSAFVLERAYLIEAGDVSDEDLTLTCFALTNEAVEVTYQGMVKRYYGSEENLPATFNEARKAKIETLIRNSTVWDSVAVPSEMPDTIRMLNGYKVISGAGTPDQTVELSNGMLQTWKSTGLLASDLMGDTLTFESTAPVSAYDEENISSDIIQIGDKKAQRYYRDNTPIEVTYTLEGLMAGQYRVYWAPLANFTGELDITLDGEKLIEGYKPQRSWYWDYLGTVTFDSYGAKKMVFNTALPYNTVDQTYGFGFHQLRFIPMKEGVRFIAR
ncbi:hypothetical protein FUAX_07450 [Fulvitalea axinellae]|uniref:FAS1 domain-containing protein n=1 Tax=Fulvitalea axinellae TaxID=1182444 RepID=A0AAU9CJZ3_9BACT|nr:hypothetical protein FUAX_07450 [Fulvitalea axinellae]